MTANAKPTQIDPREQAQIFALLGKDFQFIASEQPLYGEPKAPTLPPTASGADIIASVRRQQQEIIKRAARVANQAVAARMDEEERTKIAYIPFAIAELVWDYADTIIICCRRNKQLAKLSRAIRTLRRRYLKALPPMVSQNIHDGELIDNAYLFEEYLSDQWSKMLTALLADLQTEYPDLDEDSLTLLNAAYQAIIMARALREFMKRKSKKLTGASGWEVNVERLLPQAYKAMTLLLEEYIGDKPASARFPLNSWVNVIANQIALIKI